MCALRFQKLHSRNEERAKTPQSRTRTSKLLSPTCSSIAADSSGNVVVTETSYGRLSRLLPSRIDACPSHRADTNPLPLLHPPNRHPLHQPPERQSPYCLEEAKRDIFRKATLTRAQPIGVRFARDSRWATATSVTPWPSTPSRIRSC
jgi:hypothetical protein